MADYEECCDPEIKELTDQLKEELERREDLTLKERREEDIQLVAYKAVEALYGICDTWYYPSKIPWM